MGRLSSKEVFDQLSKIDIYVHPSLQEGLPRAVIEAMSMACPIVASNTAGTPELISNEFIFKNKSPKAISKAILTMLNIWLRLSK